HYVTKSCEKIAIVPIGHGDGYKKALVNKGEMLVGGKRAKIIGSISQDQTLINVTDIPGVSEGDEVVLLGKQGKDEITAREVAGWMNSIVDEVVSSLTERIRRVYVRGIEKEGGKNSWVFYLLFHRLLLLLWQLLQNVFCFHCLSVFG